jgi:anti-sigma B factor antagonist
MDTMEPDETRLDIEEERSGGSDARLRLAGELDLGTAPALRERLDGLTGDGRAVRIDLSGLDFMDSTGVSLLIAASQQARDDGWRLELVRPQGEAWRVIELTGIADVLPFVDE